MKKNYLTTLLLLPVLFFYQEITAQPTLTNANTSPQVGESFMYHLIDYTVGSEGASGANVTWDFSGLIGTDTLIVNWVDPSTTPYAASFSSLNICYEFGGIYDYYVSSSSDYSRQGGVQGGIVLAYSDPEKQIEYPCTFNSTFIDSFAVTFFNGVTFDRTGTITVTADAYGTVILPYGTFNDVLRLKAVEDYRDDFIGGPYLYNTEVYLWYKPGIHYPILSFTSFVSTIGSTTYGSYLDQSSVGINKTFAPEFNFNIYPNPANTFTNINYSIIKPAYVKISLNNLLGQEIKVLVNEKQPTGNYKEIVNLENLSKGVYLFRLEIDGNIEIKKVTIF